MASVWSGFLRERTVIGAVSPASAMTTRMPTTSMSQLKVGFLGGSMGEKVVVWVGGVKWGILSDLSDWTDLTDLIREIV